MKAYVVDFDMLSPLGLGQKAQWESLISQRLCGKVLSRFVADKLQIKAAAEVTDDLQPWLNPDQWSLPSLLREAMAYDRKLELGIACFHWMESRLQASLANIEPHRVGIALGMGQDIPALERIDPQHWDEHTHFETYFRFLHRGQSNPWRINRVFNPLDLLAVYVSEKLSATAFQEVILTACAASNQALAFGLNALRQGRADVVLCGGADSVINLVGYLSLLKLGVIADDGYPPEKACRPFAESRRGTLLGEGAGFVLLANEDAIKRMRVQPRFALCGSGSSLEGYKITTPEPEGAGMQRAIQTSLDDARWLPSQVNAIQLHGTGTVANDPMELQAIANVFQSTTSQILASSTKDRHGHLIGAAGVQEFCVLLQSMENNLWPAMLHCDEPIPSHGLCLVRGENQRHRIKYALNHSFAFGGVNSVLAVENLEA